MEGAPARSAPSSARSTGRPRPCVRRRFSGSRSRPPGPAACAAAHVRRPRHGASLPLQRRLHRDACGASTCARAVLPQARTTSAPFGPDGGETEAAGTLEAPYLPPHGAAAAQVARIGQLVVEDQAEAAGRWKQHDAPCSHHPLQRQRDAPAGDGHLFDVFISKPARLKDHIMAIRRLLESSPFE